MSSVFELRHRPAASAVLRVRVLPLVLAAVTLAAAAAGGVALGTQDLEADQRLTAWFLVVGGILGGAFVLHHTWRTWPAVSPDLVVIRLDEAGVQLRKGRYRDETWLRVPWDVVEGVSLSAVATAPRASAVPAVLRLLRFVPREGADVPRGPVGWGNRGVALPAREAALCFVTGATWDADLRELLAWVRDHRPDLRVEDSLAASG